MFRALAHAHANVSFDLRLRQTWLNKLSDVQRFYKTVAVAENVALNLRFSPDVLPHTLRELRFGHDFDRKLDWKALPASLRTLKFGNIFDQELDAADLPRELVCLGFGCLFARHLDASSLPPSLTELRLRHRFYRYNKHRFDLASLPPSLTILSVGIVDENVRLRLEHLPPTVRELHVVCRSIVDGASFPAGVRRLTFSEHAGTSFKAEHLPRSIRSLTIRFESKRWPIEGRLPESLERLCLEREYDGPLDATSLPASLRSLHLCGRFKEGVRADHLPRSLTDLWFGSAYVSPMKEHLLPPNLLRLTVGWRLRNELRNRKLPRSLTELRVRG